MTGLSQEKSSAGVCKHRRWYGAVVVSLAAACLTTCIAIPIPVDHTQGRAIDPQKTAIEIGVTTRDEIVARAGEPDAVWEDERIVAYSWKHANWLLIVAAGGPGAAVAGAGYLYGDQMLLIQFDTSGRVARAEQVERPSDKSYGEFLREWAKGKTNANP
jgi:hypothetical protein